MAARGRWIGAVLLLLCSQACSGGCGTSDRILYLVHASDMEGEILPQEGVGGVARFHGLLDGLVRRAPDRTLVVAAGDLFMPGPALTVRLEGEPAVAHAVRALPIEATALGNHEFDEGESFFAEMLALSPFPYLTATVSFERGPLAKRSPRLGEGEAPWIERSAGLVLPRAKRCLGRLVEAGEGLRCEGFVVGLVGATTEGLDMVASIAPSARSLSDLEAVRGAIQREVDLLEGEGIDIVVLLSHLQGAHREIEIVEQGLRGVDVIVAGGGDDRFANASHRLHPGDEPSPLCEKEDRCYPLLREGSDGAPVLVVATDGQYRYLGRLGLRFDAQGHIRAVSNDSRPWPVDDRSLEEAEATPDPRGKALEDRLQAALAPLETVVAHSAHRLNGEREEVRNRETNLGVVSVDALVHAATAAGIEVDLGLRNGGSIRSSMGAEGGAPIRRYDVDASLPFDDAVVIVRTTHRMLKETLEAGLRGVGTRRGWFPQLSSGAVLVYDPEGAEQVRTADGRGVEEEGGRVHALRFLRGEDVVEVVREGRLLDPDAEVLIVTLEYLTRGGDGYFPPNVAKFSAVSPLGGTTLGERQALVDFLQSDVWRDGAAYPDPPRKQLAEKGDTRMVEGQ